MNFAWDCSPASSIVRPDTCRHFWFFYEWRTLVLRATKVRNPPFTSEAARCMNGNNGLVAVIRRFYSDDRLITLSRHCEAWFEKSELEWLLLPVPDIRCTLHECLSCGLSGPLCSSAELVLPAHRRHSMSRLLLRCSFGIVAIRAELWLKLVFGRFEGWRDRCLSWHHADAETLSCRISWRSYPLSGLSSFPFLRASSPCDPSFPLVRSFLHP